MQVQRAGRERDRAEPASRFQPGQSSAVSHTSLGFRLCYLLWCTVRASGSKIPQTCHINGKHREVRRQGCKLELHKHGFLLCPILSAGPSCVSSSALSLGKAERLMKKFASVQMWETKFVVLFFFNIFSLNQDYKQCRYSGFLVPKERAPGLREWKTHPFKNCSCPAEGMFSAPVLQRVWDLISSRRKGQNDFLSSWWLSHLPMNGSGVPKVPALR